jgi:group I intron endonuclease
MDKKIIYCTTNIINGKKYIGSHSRGLDTYLGSGVEITKDIKILGKEFFQREILAKVDTISQMRIMEEYWCNYFNVENNDLFYNKTNKGVGSPQGWKMSEKVKQTKNLLQKGKPKHNSSSKNKIGQFHKGIDNFGNKGKKLKEEHRIKASINRYKPIIQYDLEGNFIKEWESATIVANLNKWDRVNIHACCRGDQKTSYNFKWEYKNGKN